jgi:hypothetical protein
MMKLIAQRALTPGPRDGWGVLAAIAAISPGLQHYVDGDLTSAR